MRQPRDANRHPFFIIGRNSALVPYASARCCGAAVQASRCVYGYRGAERCRWERMGLGSCDWGKRYALANSWGYCLAHVMGSTRTVIAGGVMMRRGTQGDGEQEKGIPVGIPDNWAESSVRRQAFAQHCGVTSCSSAVVRSSPPRV